MPVCWCWAGAPVRRIKREDGEEDIPLVWHSNLFYSTRRQTLFFRYLPIILALSLWPCRISGCLKSFYLEIDSIIATWNELVKYADRQRHGSQVILHIRSKLLRSSWSHNWFHIHVISPARIVLELNSLVELTFKKRSSLQFYTIHEILIVHSDWREILWRPVGSSRIPWLLPHCRVTYLFEAN